MRGASAFELAFVGFTAAFLSSAGVEAATAQEQQAALVAPNRFDGVYSVDVVTEEGACEKYRWTVVVANGRVNSRSADGDMLDVIGRIDRSGVVLLTFGRQNQVAQAGGHMKGKSGTGKWSSSTLACRGVWRAQRQD